MVSSSMNRGGNTIRARRIRAITALTALLLATGTGLRIYLAGMLPVGYDESYVMALGLNTMAESSSAFFLDVPLTQSSAITPMWWWLQYVSYAAFTEVSLFALRAIPATLGLLTLWIAWRSAAAYFSRRVALYFLAFVSLSDILIFTNSRGEFAESFTVPLIIILVCQFGSRNQPWLRGVIWSLLLFTGLVKGIFVIALMLVAEVALLLATRRDFAKRTAKLAISLVIAIVPTAAYLLWGNAHFAGNSIKHEATVAPNVFALVRTLLFDYTTVKQHVTGSAREAAFIALDFEVWPATAIMAPILIVACIAAIIGIAKRRFHTRGRLAQTRLALTIWSLVGAAVIIERGTLGARFHLMYLPALWMLAAIHLRKWRTAHVAPVCIVGAAWAAFVGYTASWSNWSEHTLDLWRWTDISLSLTGLIVVAAWLAVGLRRPPVAAACIVVGGLMVVSQFFAGPLAWADYSRFEPMPRGEELQMLDAYRTGAKPAPTDHGRSLYIDLANCYLARSNDPSDQQRALHYSRLEVERVPNDWQGWAYLGESLLRAGEDPADALRAWRRSFELEPNDFVRQKIERLEAWMRENGLAVP